MKAGESVRTLARRLATKGGEFANSQLIYAAHIAGLVRQGKAVPVYDAHRNQPGSLEAWKEDDLRLMVDEGRRQLDQQLGDLESLRGRAQFLFTVTVALVGALGALADDAYDQACEGVFVLWCVATLAGAYAGLGAAAVMTVRADFSVIDSARLSTYPSPILARLAGDYSRMLGTGANTVATRLTIFRQAVVWLIVSAILGLTVLLLT